MQSHLEARLWNDVFVEAQAELEVPRGSIRVRPVSRSVAHFVDMSRRQTQSGVMVCKCLASIKTSAGTL